MPVLPSTAMNPEHRVEDPPDVSADSRPALPDPTEDSVSELSLGPGIFPGIRRPLRSLWWLIQILLGVGFLLPLLAGLAAIPGLSLLSLGMMLDAEAKVGRSGRLRDGFPLLAVSSRVGLIALMAFLFLLPVFLLSMVANSQQIVARSSGLPQNGFWVGKTILQVIAFCFLLLAIAHGGGFGRFFWPLRREFTLRTGVIVVASIFFGLILAGIQPAFLLLYAIALIAWMTAVAWRNLRDLVSGIRTGRYAVAVNDWSERLLEIFQPWQHLKLAVKGGVGAFCWLAIPTLLLGAASTSPHQNPGPTGVLSFLGGLLIIPVAAWLPLLQCHQAATGRFAAIFDVSAVREIICRVPVRWAGATILLYGLAVPLYLSKVVSWPVDALWLFTPLFILVIYPTRILMGWVYGTGTRKSQRTPRLIRWPTKAVMIPLLGLYGLILFVLPLISESGPRAMLENHAFLLPVPTEQQD